jgi:hypothetical protein
MVTAAPEAGHGSPLPNRAQVATSVPQPGRKPSMGETGTDTPAAAARRMLDIFTSVGAERFHVTWTNSAGKPRRPRSLRKNLALFGGSLPQANNADWLDAVHIAGIGAADLHRTIPALLDTARADRLNLTVRPRGRGVRFIQLDDIPV